MNFLEKLKKTFSKKDDQAIYLSGFKKTSDNFSDKLNNLKFKYTGINDEFLEELTIVLLESDVGIVTADLICENLKDMAKEYPSVTFKWAMNFVIEIMSNIYLKEEIKEINYSLDSPTIFLIVGVNGTGKTTSIAKLAKFYKDKGKKVGVVAADTFRAGAREQLKKWADKLEVDFIGGNDNQDPSSVIVDGCNYALENKLDILLIDTAGRLQNKINLMNELAKMKRVIEKIIPNAPHNSWLVIDGTTGQNGISQATIFNEVTDLTGIILTKMDGSAKGGIVISIKHNLKLPVYFIGLGEKETDLKPFDLETYLYSISRGLDG